MKKIISGLLTLTALSVVLSSCAFLIPKRAYEDDWSAYDELVSSYDSDYGSDYASSYNSYSYNDSSNYVSGSSGGIMRKGTLTTINGEEETYGEVIKDTNIPRTASKYLGFEKYFITANVMPYSFLRTDFGPGMMDELVKGWGLELDFNPLYEYLNDGREYADDYPASAAKGLFEEAVFEETIMSFFDLTTAELHSWNQYDAEQNAYHMNGGVGSVLSCTYVINNVERFPENKMIEIYYTYYFTSWITDDDYNSWIAYEGCLTILTRDDDTFEYLSNTKTDEWFAEIG